VILFLYRESYYDQEKEKDDITEVIIAKQRQGQANRFVKVYYNTERQTYSNEKIKQGEML